MQYNWVYILLVSTVATTLEPAFATATDQGQQVLNSDQQQLTISAQQENATRLLTAEIALQNNKPEVAVENYLALLQTTPNPEIAELALTCALKHKLFSQAIKLAKLWANFAPTDVNPQIIAATLTLTSEPNLAKQYLAKAIQIEPNDIDQYLLLTHKKLPPAGQKTLATILSQLATANPTNPYFQVVGAQIAAQEEDFAQADKLVTAALTLQPKLTHALQLKAKLIREQTQSDLPALNYLKNAVAQNPQDEELKLFYGNALLDNNKFAEALPYLQELTKSKVYGVEAQFTLGELFLTQRQFTKATHLFQQVLADPNYGAPARYNLGQICEQQNKPAEAIKWFTEIDSGPLQVPAILKAAFLLSAKGAQAQALQLIQEANPTTFLEQKQLLLVELDLLVELKDLDQALKLVNNALTVVPDDVDLLYARSLMNNILNLSDQTEKDLQAILAIEPNHANALNALGYTLAKQPKRIPEALTYLEKALVLAPDNPAFLDSMGWVLFNLGKIQDATALLQNAYSLSKDEEIAAHLGEVLWTTGKQEQAKKIWHEALQNQTKHPVLIETLNRLKIKLNSTRK